MERNFTMRTLLAILVVAMSSACGSGTTDASAAQIVAGTYQLIAVNGSPLPAVNTVVLTAPATIVQGNITLSNDMTWSSELSIQQVVDGQTATSSLRQTGTYSVARDQIRVVESGTGSLATGTVTDGRIVVTSRGTSFDFRRS
jgi:hypothetical protein